MTIYAEEIIVWVLVFLRTGAFFLGIPLFAGKLIPKKIRVAFALMLSLLVNPLVPADLHLAHHFAGAILLAMNEVCIGLLLALSVRMVFFALELAGHLISYEIGLMASSSVNPLLGSSDSTLSSLLYYFGLVVFFVAGVHYDVLRAFTLSFDVLPVGKFFHHANPIGALIRESATVFALGTLMAAPFIALNFLVNISFAVLGKAVPKMNVFITSFAVRIVCGITLLASSVLLITAYVLEHSRRSAFVMIDIISP